MKILLINYTDVGGGAAIAAFRITEALYNAGINITMGVIQKKTEVKVHSAPTPVKYVNLINRTKDLTKEELDYANLADEYIQKEI